MTDHFGYPEQRSPRPVDEGGESLSTLVARYWVLFKRFYWILILTSIAAVTVAYLYTDRQTRIYQASSKLIFHESQPNVFGNQFERVEFIDPGGRWQFEQFWNTQREILGSKWFAEQVLDREGLLDDPNFLPENPENPRSEEARRRAGIRTLQGITSYSLQRDSRVARVEVRFRDPELAARIADGVAEAYVDYIRDFQSGGIEQLANWFDDYVSSQREQLDGAQAALQEYQRDNNILSLSFDDRRTMTGQALDSISARLRDVEADLFREDALLMQIAEMEETGDNLRALGDLVDNPFLKRSLERERDLMEQRARLMTRYLESHPSVREVDEQLVMVRESIDEEIGRIRAAVENRVAVIRRNARNLEQERSRLTQQVAELNEIGFGYTQKRNAAETLRQHYEAVLNRTTELDLNQLYERDIIQVLENAEIPGAPISPQVPLNLAVGLLVGVFAGLGIMVLIDALDNTVKSNEHIARYTDRPILGTLPSVNKSALKGVEAFGESPLDTLTHTAPRSSFAEGIKTLRTNMLFMAPDKPPQVLLMTSPGPGEGKTLTSVNMAIALAQSGQRVLLIDSDMRRPRVHKALGLKNISGLSNLILGETSIEEAVMKAPFDEKNLDILTCGPVPPNPSELLHTEEFRRLVRDLRDRYDRIIFDSPPLGAVSDALILSHVADALFLILKFGQTRQELLGRSVEQLEAIGAPFVGTVLNNIDTDSGYGYAYYYRYRYDEPEDKKRQGPHEEKLSA